MKRCIFAESVYILWLFAAGADSCFFMPDRRAVCNCFTLAAKLFVELIKTPMAVGVGKRRLAGNRRSSGLSHFFEQFTDFCTGQTAKNEHGFRKRGRVLRRFLFPAVEISGEFADREGKLLLRYFAKTQPGPGKHLPQEVKLAGIGMGRKVTECPLIGCNHRAPPFTSRQIDLILQLKLVLADAAERAFKVFGKILPFGSGCNAVLGISGGLVIDIAADFANILFHQKAPF